MKLKESNIFFLSLTHLMILQCEEDIHAIEEIHIKTDDGYWDEMNFLGQLVIQVGTRKDLGCFTAKLSGHYFFSRGKVDNVSKPDQLKVCKDYKIDFNNTVFVGIHHFGMNGGKFNWVEVYAEGKPPYRCNFTHNCLDKVSEEISTNCTFV